MYETVNEILREFKGSRIIGCIKDKTNKEEQMATIVTLDVSDKDSIDLNEYNGTYELISKYGGYQNWAKYRIGKDAYSEKDRPVKVVLGNAEKAEEVLLNLLGALTGKKYEPADVPF